MTATKKKRVVDVQNSQTPERETYLKTLKKIAEGNYCPFCESNISKNHPKPILVRGKHWLATPSNWPYKGSKHHFLFITRLHVESIETLSAAQWSELHTTIRALTKKYKIHGATFMMRFGDTKTTGATVNHLHAHLIVGHKRGVGTKDITTVVGFGK